MLKRSQSGIPYTSEELRALADRVDEITNGLILQEILEEDDFRWGLTCSVYLDGYVVGMVASHPDGFFGFFPESWSKDD